MNETDSEESRELVAMPVSALEALTRGELDQQIITAHRFRRSVTRFRQVAESLATLDRETAESCFYVLKRKGRNGQETRIEGPGVRLAEIAAAAWGNLRCGARVISDDGRFVVAQGYAHDLETNVAMTVEVRRRITDRNGIRYSDDMVGVTANAACAIALRNAVLKIIPRAQVDQVFQAAKATALGDHRTLGERVARALEWFAGRGVEVGRVLAVLGREATGDLTLADLETLMGLRTALQDGDTTVAEAFPEPAAPAPAGDLAERIRARKKAASPAPAPAAGEEPPSGSA